MRPWFCMGLAVVSTWSWMARPAFSDEAPAGVAFTSPIHEPEVNRSVQLAPGVRRVRAVRVDASKLKELKLPAKARLGLFDDVQLDVVLERREGLSLGGTAWHGHVAGLRQSSVTLVITEGVVAGAIHAGPAGAYDLLPGPTADINLARELDPGTQARCGGVLVDPKLTRAIAPRPGAQLDANRSFNGPPAASAPPVTGCDDGTVIDLMVVYTTAARIGAGGTASIHALIDLAIADTNAAFDRSLIDTSLRLVHRQEVAYTETGNVDIDAPRLIDNGDGYLDEVHPLRDQYGADCVSLWLSSYGGAGYGYYPHPSLKGVGASGITLMGYQGAGGLLLAHEIGHNLWCAHDRDNHDFITMPYAEYSFGYREPGQAWHDIMAYDPGVLIPYFANPNVIWPGPNPPNPGPIGVPVGQPEPCDIALTIADTRHIVANFRPTVIPGQPAVLYVRADAAPGGNGQSWATAFNDLQDALCSAAGSGGAVQEIWVKAGVYKPDRGSGLRSATFQLVDGVAIYGGFAGTETQRGQRDVEANITTLSGDIGTAGVHTDNCYHVVTGTGTDATAVLDGFTISYGYADGGTDIDDGGGGLVNYEGGSPTIANCTFSFNTGAQYGGAVYNYLGAEPRFVDCVFTNNVSLGTVWPAGGGAIYSYDQCSLTLEGCNFENNSGNVGGAIASLFDSTSTLTSCTFDGNTATGNDAQGGGIYNYSECPSSLTGCVFTANHAREGAGMDNLFDSPPELTACTFSGNSTIGSNAPGAGIYTYSCLELKLTGCTFDQNVATGDGGALYTAFDTEIYATDCVFSANTANYGGAIINISGIHTRMINCIIRGNTAHSDGGGIASYSSSPVQLVNCLLAGNNGEFGGGMLNLTGSDALLINTTFAGNIGRTWAGGLYDQEANPTIVNGLFWGNRVGAVMDENAQMARFNSTPTIRYTSVQGWTGALGGTANNGANPQFVDADGADNVYGTADDNPRPQAGSPAVDTGDTTAVPPDVSGDLDGGPRVLGLAVDRGAYESVPLHPADFDGDGDVDGQDWVAFESCASGPAIPHAGGCDSRDFDSDGDVDGSDFGAFQRCYSGTDQPAEAGCAAL